MVDYSDAIASIESGGRYDLVGPRHPTMGRALGRYQVMESNVGPWTKQYLGQELTPDQFLNTPEAQDAVFNGRFGQYAQKYGPEGAAKAWFAGEGGMNNPNARDSLGTSVEGYAQKFMKAMGADAQAATTPAAQPGSVPQAAPPASAPSGPMFAAAQPGILGGGNASPGSTGGLLGDLGGQGTPQMPQMSPMAALPMPPPRRQVDLSRLRAMLAAPPQMTGWAV